MTFSAGAENAKLLSQAGTSSGLLQALQAIQPATITQADSGCSAKVAQAGELARRKRYSDASDAFGALLIREPRNAAFHFVMGYLHLQQGELDDAFDEFSIAKEIMPSLPQNHTRLAMSFTGMTMATTPLRRLVPL